MMQFAANQYQENNNQIYFVEENASRTVFIADLPLRTSYLELANFFEGIGVNQVQIQIKRPIFKNFYFAYVQFSKLEDA